MTVHNIEVLRQHGAMVQHVTGWYAARPIGWPPFSVERLKAAWGVLTGKFDAISWPLAQRWDGKFAPWTQIK